MPQFEKILWVVHYDDLQKLLATATDIGASAVAIRSDNNVKSAIAAGHPKNLKVYAWRWPSAKRDPALQEADKIVDLAQNGLDGYFVDPEPAPGKPYDWDQPGLDDLAAEFCSRIRTALGSRPLGVTSHYLAKSNGPNLPWTSFFNHADVLLPQSYWRSSEGIIGHGIPADNYARGIEFWEKAGGDKARIVPMGGVLGSTTPEDIKAYADAANQHGITTLHFYCYEDAVKAAIWSAIKAL
jgi:hypothetical protein